MFNYGLNILSHAPRCIDSHVANHDPPGKEGCVYVILNIIILLKNVQGGVGEGGGVGWRLSYMYRIVVVVVLHILY
jgi:hypothetical protein